MFPVEEAFFKKSLLSRARASGGGGAHEVSDSQSKHHEHHTQLHGRGIHRADRFLRKVFRPRGNSREDRTAKEGQVTMQVKVTS